MGEPNHREVVTDNWIHRLLERTWGTETSKYPEEKKSTEISLVAASERELADTIYILSEWNCLERWTKGGESPVHEGWDKN